MDHGTLVVGRSEIVHLQVAIGKFKARNLPAVPRRPAHAPAAPEHMPSVAPLRLELRWGQQLLLATGEGAHVATVDGLDAPHVARASP